MVFSIWLSVNVQISIIKVSNWWLSSLWNHLNLTINLTNIILIPLHFCMKYTFNNGHIAPKMNRLQFKNVTDRRTDLRMDWHGKV